MKILVSFAIICLGLLGVALWQFGIRAEEPESNKLEIQPAATTSMASDLVDESQTESRKDAVQPEMAGDETGAVLPDAAAVIEEATDNTPEIQESQSVAESESAINWAGEGEQHRLKQRFIELRDMLVSDSHNQELLATALDLAYKLEWHNEACDLLIRLLREDPEDAALRFKLATQLMRLERWLEAISNLKQVLAQQPENELALYNLAIAHQALGHLREARLTWIRIIELAPDNPDAYAHRGEVYLDLHDWEKAAADFEQALKLEPEALDASMNLALALVKLGQADQARLVLLPLLREYPRNVPLLNRLAEVTWLLYQADPAVKHDLAAQAHEYCVRSLALVNDQPEISKLAEQAEQVAR